MRSTVGLRTAASKSSTSVIQFTSLSSASLLTSGISWQNFGVGPGILGRKLSFSTNESYPAPLQCCAVNPSSPLGIFPCFAAAFCRCLGCSFPGRRSSGGGGCSCRIRPRGHGDPLAVLTTGSHSASAAFFAWPRGVGSRSFQVIPIHSVDKVHVGGPIWCCTSMFFLQDILDEITGRFVSNRVSSFCRSSILVKAAFSGTLL